MPSSLSAPRRSLPALLVALAASFLPLLVPHHARAADPLPGIRILVPGFTVTELPIQLTNLNDLAYAPDGRLFAAGYDGRIHLLRDTNGDGLEDQVQEYWNQPTLRTPLGLAWTTEGLYVVVNGKIVLLKDTDNDGRADAEQTVVSGWAKDDGFTGGGVDAVGIAFDKQNNLYFGLGCANFANAYRLDNGKPRYDLASERGTILKVSPDRKTREIFCTGYRFSINMAFNRHGDLFATDQEGETWLPHGNPRDELNHIQRGKHYGFPPRDPDHLPNVENEPPVIAFGPQHQSACGLIFNDSSPAQKRFGPRDWEGDAFVCGFSRGKLWRVRLAKTDQGYVGRHTLFAQSDLMPFDAAISPAGDLIVSCHSGPPDWGTGPQGQGKLFKIRFTNDSLPQPVIVWAASPIEVRVPFDRPLPVAAGAIATSLAGQSIEFGPHVRAADRFENLKPPYDVVKRQESSPRGKLPIVAARLTDDRRTLVLTTHPHPQPVHYALSLPAALIGDDRPGETLELDYNLHGVDASWTSEPSTSQPPPASPSTSAKPSWRGWLPVADLAASLEFLRGSADHEPLRELARAPGRLTHHSRHITDPHNTEPPHHEPLWVPPLQPESLPASPPPELAGGDWQRGQQVFLSSEAQCSTCHAVRGAGGKIGPDLSNLSHRDPGSIVRDVIDPSAMINPDFVSYTALLKDGRSLSGVLRPETGDRLRLLDTNAKDTVLQLSEIESLRPSSTSIMPAGIDKKLGPDRLRDLLVFLTQPDPSAAASLASGGQPPAAQPSPAPASSSQAKTDPSDAPPDPNRPQRPPRRKRSELEGPLKAYPTQGEKSAKGDPAPLKIVLVASKQDHGPGEHDYPAWQKQWQKLFASLPAVTVETPFEWPSDEQWKSADVVVCYFWNHDWSPARYKQLDAFLHRGGGLVMLHSATIADRAPEQLAERIGLSYHPGLKYRHGPLDLSLVPENDPLLRALPRKIHFYDESYWPPIGDPKKVHVLATAVEENQPHPLVWTFEPQRDAGGKGRVFCSVLGHYHWTYDDPLFRLLWLRGLAWAANQDLARFQPLVTEGIGLEDD